jgi:hypothetical protein
LAPERLAFAATASPLMVMAALQQEVDVSILSIVIFLQKIAFDLQRYNIFCKLENFC